MKKLKLLSPDHFVEPPAATLYWSADRPPMFFKECEDYAHRIDILWRRSDLLPIERQELAWASRVIGMADRNPRARKLPLLFDRGVTKGLPQVAYLEDLIDACEYVEAVEDRYGPLI